MIFSGEEEKPVKRMKSVAIDGTEIRIALAFHPPETPESLW